jgi:hypothetical protein
MAGINNSLVLCVATLRWSGWLDSVKSWYQTASPAELPLVLACGKEILPAYQECYERTREPILGFVHDDLLFYEQDWDMRVREEFRDTGVGVVGIAGAIGHGTPNLYTVPYHLPNLARQGFVSNLRHWQQHGGHFTGRRDVAVIDGMAIFVRRTVLKKWGGWPVGSPLGYHLYTEALCCETRRQGLRIRLLGIEADHLGGRTSTTAAIKEDYAIAHRFLFDTYRDVLPYRVSE